MEEVTLYIKGIDNSQLRRKADPKGKAAWTRFVLSGSLVLLTVLVSYGPRAWLRHSGYRQAELEKEYQALLEINRQLKVRQAMLSDLQRISYLAAGRGLVEPLPENFAWQDRTIPAGGGVELAHNQAADSALASAE
jgi:hypothetical protein